MALHFILGRSGTGKTRACREAILTDLAQGEEGPPLIWLVPEQATFQVERAVLADPRIAGFSRLRVLSFNRLGFHLLARAPGRREISRVGRCLLLTQILETHAARLRVLSGVTTTPAVAEVLAGWITECQQQGCDPADLEAAAERLPGECPTAAKLRDLAVILAAYTEAVTGSSGRVVDPGWDLHQASRAVGQTPWLHGAHLWIDGFSGFTAPEWELLAALLPCAAEVAVALCLDPRALDLDSRDPGALDPESLFGAAEQTYVALAGLCQRLAIPLAAPQILTEPRRFGPPVLAAVEAGLYAESEPCPWQGPVTGLRVCVAPQARTEVEIVARRMEALVRNRGLRYRDIAVILPDLSLYPGYIEAAFGDAAIPFFLDRPWPLSHHPLVALLGAVFRIAVGGLQTADMLALLKTGLTPLDRDQAEALEGLCVTLGIEAGDWTEASVWSGVPEVAAWRRDLVTPLVTLRRDLAAGPVTAGRLVRCLWHLLEAWSVPQRLATWVAEEPEGLHAQALDAVVDLLDQTAWVLGDTAWPLATWGAALGRAVAGLTVRRIPPTQDQVLVGTVERSRHPDIRAAFLLGVTQKAFPIPLRSDPVLTDADRALALEQAPELNLAPPQVETLAQRRYLGYIALTRAADVLHLSYPAVDTGGRALEPAPVIDDLRRLLPALRVETLAETPLDPEQAATPTALADALCRQLLPSGTDTAREAAIDTIQALAAAEVSTLAAAVRPLRHALLYTNEARLEPALAARLHTDPWRTSATALEAFATCPYRYFAKRVLRLRPRRPLEFAPLDAGDLYHRALDRLFRDLRDRGQVLPDLDDWSRDRAVQRALEAVIQADPRCRRFMERDAFSRFQVERCGDVLRDCARDLAAMSRAGRFRPAGTELSFGTRGELPALDVDLGDGHRLLVEGRIDRVDLMPTGDGAALALVFDYKRSATSAKFALDRWVHGLSLQTALYPLALEHVTWAGQQITACIGAFLVPVEVSDSVEGFETGKEPGFGRKARGLFDGSYAATLDPSPGGTGSRFYAYSFKQGEPYGRPEASSAFAPTDYRRIQAHSRALIARLGRAILDGDIAVRPSRIGTDDPCLRCDYRALCKVDPSITPPRLLPDWGRREVLAHVQETVDA